MISERIKRLETACAKRGLENAPAHFIKDYHYAGVMLYAELPLWEKIARSMAYAVVNQDVLVYEDDGLGGRAYHMCEAPIVERCPDLDYNSEPQRIFAEECPDVKDIDYNNFMSVATLGHISWNYERILRLGTEGMKAECERALLEAKDEAAEQFYKGVIIMLDALQEFNDKHVAAYEELGYHELAERMKRVPRYPCESFADAVQAYFMQHIVVMAENPYGGNSPGRLDYYLWPYLERDLATGRCTREEAKELIDELFLRIDERLRRNDTWGETIVVGGTAPDGGSAVNPLSYILIESMMDLNITHPFVYIRLPESSPKELLSFCTEYMLKGNNRAQILNDKAIIGALVAKGIPYSDAVNYACGGCMEIGIQGKHSDYLYCGMQNIPKMLELMVTGGYCLRQSKQYDWFGHKGSLAAYSDFESFYSDFIDEVGRYVRLVVRRTDIYSEYAEKHRPAYLISSMIDDCIARGRNMNAGGATYHDYGYAPVGLPNVADGLYAIKVAVFDKRICTADELIEAMKNNYEGYERLQAQLRAIPKYGMDDDGADAMAGRLMKDVADLYYACKTRCGGTAKPVIFTFRYSAWISQKIGATPDGRKLGGSVAHGLTPYSASMTEGITAAINSCTKMPHEHFFGGASSMWDLDADWADASTVEALLGTFIERGGQIFQGNTTSLDELIEAQKRPEEYKHLFVRVGGYSARFVNLEPVHQNEVINRIRHKA